MARANIIIDEGFARLAPPPSPAQADGLERSLLAFPLIIWAGRDILLDGHHRFQNLPKSLPLPDRQAAQEWTAAHQLEKRNVGRSGESSLPAPSPGLEEELLRKLGPQREVCGGLKELLET